MAILTASPLRSLGHHASTPRKRASNLLACSLIVAGLVPFALNTQPAAAQMFGSRQVGRSLAPRGRSGAAAEDAGTVRNQRFVRGNRSSRSFVGADRGDAGRLVGSLQAGTGGTVRSATSNLRRANDESTQVNRPARPAPPNRPYNPRLAVRFDHDTPTSDELAAQFSRRLKAHGLPIAVSVEDRTAILRGEVSSAEDRDLAEILANFEPGISDVRNELIVVAVPANELPLRASEAPRSPLLPMPAQDSIPLTAPLDPAPFVPTRP